MIFTSPRGTAAPIFLIALAALWAAAMPAHGLLAQAPDPTPEAEPAEQAEPQATEAPQNGVAEAAEVPQGGALALLEQGKKKFEEGNYAEAVKLFEQAFGLNPGHEEIARFLDAANTVIALQMARSDDPKLRGVGVRLLELRRAARRAKSSDQEQAKALVERVFAIKDNEERLVAMLQGAVQYGRNLVPFLLPKLGDPESATRTQAYIWIHRIELQALPAILPAVHHPSAMVRQNVARLLGAPSLRHAVSLGALKGLAESDPEPEVKRAAMDSFRVIVPAARKKDAGGDLSAKEYHLEAAKILYRTPQKNPFDAPEYTPAVYALSGEEVVPEPVLPFQVTLRLAEQELVEALRLDPAYEAALILRASVEALLLVQYDQAVAEGGEEVKALLEAQKPQVDSLRRLRLRAQPASVLYGALALALQDRRPEVAEKIIEVIQANAYRGPVPEALVTALGDETSRRVRVAAAIALARWNPEDVSGFGDVVVSTLAEAAVSSGVRIVHTALGNRDTVSRFAALFRDLDLEAGTNSGDVVEAYRRSVELPPDLVVVDEEMKPLPRATNARAPVNDFINELRKSYRTAQTPVVVVVDSGKIQERRALYESEERKVLVVPADCDPRGFRTQVVERLFAVRDDVKSRAARLAAQATQALAELTANPTRFPVAAAADSLVKVLQSRPDEVRVPSLQALGNLRGAAAGALAAIARVFGTAENAVPVRHAAMVALGRILAAGEEPAPATVLRTILAGMAAAEPEIREASFVAFGAAAVPPAEALRVLTLEAKLPGPPAAKPAEGEAPEAKPEGEKPEGEAPEATGEAGAENAPEATPEEEKKAE